MDNPPPSSLETLMIPSPPWCKSTQLGLDDKTLLNKGLVEKLRGDGLDAVDMDLVCLLAIRFRGLVPVLTLITEQNASPHVQGMKGAGSPRHSLTAISSLGALVSCAPSTRYLRC